MQSVSQSADVRTVVAVEDGNLVTGTVQDCSPIVESVARLRAAGGGKLDKDMWHLGRIPDVIVEKYCNESQIEFSEFMQNPVHVHRILQDPAYSKFRVFEGAI